MRQAVNANEMRVSQTWLSLLQSSLVCVVGNKLSHYGGSYDNANCGGCRVLVCRQLSVTWGRAQCKHTHDELDYMADGDEQVTLRTHSNHVFSSISRLHQWVSYKWAQVTSSVQCVIHINRLLDQATWWGIPRAQTQSLESTLKMSGGSRKRS